MYVCRAVNAGGVSGWLGKLTYITSLHFHFHFHFLPYHTLVKVEISMRGREGGREGGRKEGSAYVGGVGNVRQGVDGWMDG